MVPSTSDATDDRAQSEVLGYLFVVAFLVLLYAGWQVTVVPQQNAAAEYRHSEAVHADLQSVRNAVASAPGSGEGTRSVPVKVTGEYPDRILFLNPPSMAGELRTRGTGDGSVAVRIENATAVGETGDFWNGTDRSYSTGSLTYRPGYQHYDGPVTVYENGVLADRSDGGNVTLTDQTLIDGNRIRIATLNGSLQVLTTETDPVDVSLERVSSSSRSVAVRNDSANLTVTVSTRLTVGTWRDLLSEEMDPPGGSDDPDAHVVGVSLSDAVPGEPYRNVSIHLEPGETYDLRMAKVAVGPSATPEREAYVTDVAGNGSAVRPEETATLVVEVRDRYNNPVANRTVTASVLGGPGANESVRAATPAGGPRSARSGEDGQATFVYDAGTEPGVRRVEASLPGVAGREGNVSFVVRVEESSGGGGASSDVVWNRTALLAQEGITESGNGYRYDRGADSDGELNLTAVRPDGRSNLPVEFAVSNRSVATVETAAATTGTGGTARATLNVTANGTVYAYVTSTGDGDRVRIDVGDAETPSNREPSATFDFDPPDPTAGERVTFDASGSRDPDGSVGAWNWEFGDGATASGETAAHTYGAAGDYTVTLTVTDDDGATATTTRTVSVSPAPSNEDPVARFDVEPATPLAGEAANFDASASSDPDGSIATWNWEFGDGTTAAGETATHDYDAAGEYAVTLTVTDDDGATNSATETVTVEPVPPALVWESANDWDAGEGRLVHDDVGDRNASAVRIGANATESGLVGYWPLDEDAGPTVADATGRNDGTVTTESGDAGTYELGAEGTYNASAIRFDPDGTDDRGAWVDLGDDTAAALADGAFTLTAWINTSAGDKDAIVGFNRPDDANGLIWYLDGGRLSLYDRTFDTGGPVVADGEWHHVAVTVAPNDATTYYVDGEAVYDTTTSGRVRADDVMSIGQEYDDGDFGGFGPGPSDFLEGRVDDVRAYDRALGTPAVRALADGEGVLRTGGEAFARAVDPTTLRLENVSAVVPPGTNATVVVESSPPGTAAFDEASDPVALSGGQSSYAVGDGTLSTRSATYRLRVELNTSRTTVTPCLTGAVLSAGNGTGRGFGTGACGEETAAVAPTANVSYAPGDPRAGERVTFDARNSTDPDGSITAYEWEFGDGTTATGETATRTYDAAGEYAVTLTVTDDDGTTNATTETVSVDPAPALVWNDAADWDASDGSGVVHDDFGDHAAGVVELGTPADSLSGKPVVGYWPLDGSGASTAEDVSGGGYDGSPSGGVAGSVPGIHGTTGYEFDGTGWVELPGFPDLQRDFSVVAWMKTDDRTEGGQRVFVDDERNAGGYALSVGDQGNAGRLRFYSRGMDTVSLDSSGRPIGTDQWHLVVGVADLTNDTRTVYVDGTRVGRFDPDSGTWGTDGGSAAIGGETAAGETGNRFDGTIDEVRVVDGDLSASEVSSLYDAATNGSVVTDARTYSGPVDVADLALGGVSLVEPGGTNVTVAVEAYDAAAGTWRSSDPIDVAEANEGPYRIPGLGGAYERYRLRVSLESTSPTESPCFGGAVLVGDGESAPATDGDGCDATAE